MIERWMRSRIEADLRIFPVVMLTGARQVGKTTLARALVSAGWPAEYRTLDARPQLDAALGDPDGFLAQTRRPLILDEVQRAPDLLRAIKLLVDRDRRPGRFLVTGSANLLTMRQVSETLAGRVGVCPLFPLSWGELSRRPPAPRLQALFGGRPRDLFEGEPPSPALPPASLILRGGYPPVTRLKTAVERAAWFAAYRQTYLERDVRDLATLEHWPDFNRLLVACAARTGQLFNVADLARDLQRPATTIRRYLALLELTYQVVKVPPYFANVGKRLVKMPKLFVTDTGLACSLLGVEAWADLERLGKIGPMVETWVAMELHKLIGVARGSLSLYFWREHAGREVDFLLVRGEEIVGLEVTWSRRLDSRVTAGLRACAESLRNRFRLGIVLYPGDQVIGLGRDLLAVPFRTFFGI